MNPQIAPSTVRLSGSERTRERFASKYVPDVVVLLTDGAATTGVDPRTAARQAADRGVRVFTIGFGTANPSMLSCTAEQFGGDTLDPYGGGGGGILIPGGGGPGGPGTRQLPPDRRADAEGDRPHDRRHVRARCQRVAAQPGVGRAAPTRW